MTVFAIKYDLFILKDDPQTSRCIGIFGLSLYTQERELKEVFGRFGAIDTIQVVMDHQTGRSRGFAFIYYRDEQDAIEVCFCSFFCFFNMGIPGISIAKMHHMNKQNDYNFLRVHCTFNI